MLQEEIGRRVYQLRIMTDKYTQQQLADLVGCDKTFIYKIETGKQNATISTINDICNALDISLSKFFAPLNGKYESKK